MFAFQQAPFFDSDEKAHLGYAHEIADFRLPEIERQPSVPDSATQWRVERSTGRDDRYRAVWVANHPPLHYVAVAPLIWYAETTDRPDGGLLLMRFANIAFAAAGVVFTYLLGTELTGGRSPGRPRRSGDRRPRAAGTHLLLARLNDGLAFAAGTGLLWAGVRCLRRTDRRNLTMLGCHGSGRGRHPDGDDAAGHRRGRCRRLRPTRPARREPWRQRVRGAALIGRRSASARRPCCSGGSTCASSCCMATSGRRPSCWSTSAVKCAGAFRHVLSEGRLWSHLFHRMVVDRPAVVGLAEVRQHRRRCCSGWAGPRARPAAAGHEPASNHPVPRRHRGDHADGGAASRRRRESVPALLLSDPRRAGRPRRCGSRSTGAACSPSS